MTISSEIRAVHSALSSCGGIIAVKHTNRPIEVLHSRHIMTAILFLHENGPSRRVNIYRNVSRNSNMSEKIGALLESGIIS